MVVPAISIFEVFKWVLREHGEAQAIQAAAKEIRDELIRQIKQSEAVFVLSSAWEENHDQVNFMMDVAEANNIGMIAIKPFGGMRETPPELVQRCAEHIEWNDREMVDALKRQARGEDTASWEVLDFPGWDENGPIEQ